MSESSQPKVPAVIDQENGLDVLIPAELDPTRTTSPVWVSWKPQTDLDRATLLTALTGRVSKLGENINKTINVVNVAFQGVQLVHKETGELVPAVRTVLFAADGQPYSCVSDGVRTALGIVFKLWGNPPWQPPMPLTVKQVELGTGRRMFTLDFDAVTGRVPSRRAK